MNRQDEADYTALKEYLCDMILEEQLKLGYERETIRFYSPSSSIGHVLKLSDRSQPAVLAALEGFSAYAADTLGEVTVSRASGGRICFLIPAAGAEYVHAHGVAHPFLKDLIDCFGRHDVTREQVWELFRHYSESARIIEIKSDEFDDVCYFEDGNPDSYLYCVKFDEGHAFYHRFLKEDFEELFGEASRMKGAR